MPVGLQPSPLVAKQWTGLLILPKPVLGALDRGGDLSRSPEPRASKAEALRPGHTTLTYPGMGCSLEPAQNSHAVPRDCSLTHIRRDFSPPLCWYMVKMLASGCPPPSAFPTTCLSVVSQSAVGIEALKLRQPLTLKPGTRRLTVSSMSLLGGPASVVTTSAERV